MSSMNNNNNINKLNNNKLNNNEAKRINCLCTLDQFNLANYLQTNRVINCGRMKLKSLNGNMGSFMK